ncbi:MAG: hypothetical protein ACLTXM_03160 [Enterococcus sp.]
MEQLTLNIFFLESHLRLIKRIDEEIHVLNEAIEEITSEYAEIMEALQTIPGVKKQRPKSFWQKLDRM